MDYSRIWLLFNIIYIMRMYELGTSERIVRSILEKRRKSLVYRSLTSIGRSEGLSTERLAAHWHD